MAGCSLKIERLIIFELQGRAADLEFSARVVVKGEGVAVTGVRIRRGECTDSQTGSIFTGCRTAQADIRRRGVRRGRDGDREFLVEGRAQFVHRLNGDSDGGPVIHAQGLAFLQLQRGRGVYHNLKLACGVLDNRPGNVTDGRRRMSQHAHRGPRLAGLDRVICNGQNTAADNSGRDTVGNRSALVVGETGSTCIVRGASVLCDRSHPTAGILADGLFLGGRGLVARNQVVLVDNESRSPWGQRAGEIATKRESSKQVDTIVSLVQCRVLIEDVADNPTVRERGLYERRCCRALSLAGGEKCFRSKPVKRALDFPEARLVERVPHVAIADEDRVGLDRVHIELLVRGYILCERILGRAEIAVGIPEPGLAGLVSALVLGHVRTCPGQMVGDLDASEESFEKVVVEPIRIGIGAGDRIDLDALDIGGRRGLGEAGRLGLRIGDV